jgi:hypothetical protein
MVQLDHLHTSSNRDLPRSVVGRTNIIITEPDRRVFQRVDNHRVSIGILTACSISAVTSPAHMVAALASPLAER